jgi:hypothetical protein
MGGQTVMIVPAAVPAARVLHTQRAEPESPILISAEPAVVPRARATRLVSAVLTPELVAQLRAENAGLREQLSRVRTD